MLGVFLALFTMPMILSAQQSDDSLREGKEGLPEVHLAPMLVGEAPMIVSSRTPSDCTECGEGCIELETKVTRQGAVMLETAEVSLDLTKEEPSICVRYDGHADLDEGLRIIASNSKDIPFLLQAEDDGKKVYERFVHEGDKFEHLVVLQGRRQLTYRFNIDPQFVSLLPAKATLNLIRAKDRGYSPPEIGLIVRFGRFPHRNEALGRESTAEEVEFLKGPDSSF
jgi:hypothetical protein